MRRRNELSDEELIGHCPVDSGQILLIDPCYLSSWKHGKFESSDEDFSIAKPKNDYDECCIRTCGPKSAGQIKGKMAVVTHSCWGDGNYPVYARRNREGRISQVTIYFDNDPNEPQEGEDDGW